ncbi:hypothetical protein FGO68_gene4111 [Halteria grandinella]|uniref:Uncharacterized protein n=1 Tax=Halteria grandinella TaxID=5974 RepID=A0A8J8NYR6_HALGN|nr:hypothetical protein FGO68_gene4111 [Halteria grandinella]
MKHSNSEATQKGLYRLCWKWNMKKDLSSQGNSTFRYAEEVCKKVNDKQKQERQNERLQDTQRESKRWIGEEVKIL